MKKALRAIHLGFLTGKVLNWSRRLSNPVSSEHLLHGLVSVRTDIPGPVSVDLHPWTDSTGQLVLVGASLDQLLLVGSEQVSPIYYT